MLKYKGTFPEQNVAATTYTTIKVKVYFSSIYN